VKFSVLPSILLNNKERSPLGLNEGVNFTPRGQISPLGAKFTPRDEVKNGPLCLFKGHSKKTVQPQFVEPQFVKRQFVEPQFVKLFLSNDSLSNFFNIKPQFVEPQFVKLFFC
jgi:hypothetical protein